MEDKGKISDGYHTFDELYEHRNLLFINLIKLTDRDCWWSCKHEDGTMFDGMVIVGWETIRGLITYHMDDSYIPLLKRAEIDERDFAPEWDGHTSQDVIDRLKKVIDGKEFRFNLDRKHGDY